MEQEEEERRVAQTEQGRQAAQAPAAGSSGADVTVVFSGWPGNLGLFDNFVWDVLLASAPGVVAGENSLTAAERL